MNNNELKHYGVLGMKWGVRRYQNKDGARTTAGRRRYNPQGIRATLADRQNKKVDKSFKDWEINKQKRETATDLGKKANLSKLASQKDPSNKDLKTQSKKDSKEYKKALKKNTTYRQGAVRQDVGRDAARKLLSEAKKVEKALQKDPSNRQLQKQYNKLMSDHAVERAKARRALEVGQKRSNRIASLKRAKTMAIKGAVTTAAISVGTIATNSYLKSKGHQGINVDAIKDIIKTGKSVMRAAGYFY